MYVRDMPDLALGPSVIHNTDSSEALISFVHLDILDADPTEIKAGAILSSTNATIDLVNAHVLDILPGDLLTAAVTLSIPTPLTTRLISLPLQTLTPLTFLVYLLTHLI